VVLGEVLDQGRIAEHPSDCEVPVASLDVVLIWVLEQALYNLDRSKVGALNAVHLLLGPGVLGLEITAFEVFGGDLVVFFKFKQISHLLECPHPDFFVYAQVFFVYELHAASFV